MTNYPIRLILADLRSNVNVGSIIRTADALGVELIYAAGYTPYPQIAHDNRPPHIIHANTKAIAKTALGAEQTVPIVHVIDTVSAIAQARQDGFKIIILEQAKNSLKLSDFIAEAPIALVLGSEVLGIQNDVLSLADAIIEIPMLGQKESFGVAVAAGIALYTLRFGS